MRAIDHRRERQRPLSGRLVGLVSRAIGAHGHVRVGHGLGRCADLFSLHVDEEQGRAPCGRQARAVGEGDRLLEAHERRRAVGGQQLDPLGDEAATRRGAQIDHRRGRLRDAGAAPLAAIEDVEAPADPVAIEPLHAAGRARAAPCMHGAGARLDVAPAAQPHPVGHAGGAAENAGRVLAATRCSTTAGGRATKKATPPSSATTTPRLTCRKHGADDRAPRRARPGPPPPSGPAARQAKVAEGEQAQREPDLARDRRAPAGNSRSDEEHLLVGRLERRGRACGGR